MKDQTELQNSINKLFDILKQYPDSPKKTYDFIAFLKSFLRIKSTKPLPTIEVMTLIRHRKPIVFSNLRRMAPNNQMLEILTELSMDIESAEERLNNLLN